MSGKRRVEERREKLLVLRSQSGDREALDVLLQSVQGPLFAYLKRLVGDHHRAEDLLQDVFILIYRKLGWLRDPKLFRPWCYRIASRQAFRALKKRWPVEELPDDLPAPEKTPLFNGFAEQLPALMESISPASRAVLLLHYLEGLTIREVADVLEISIGTAKSRLAYGLKVARQNLAGNS